MAKVISSKILKAKGEANELEEEVAKALMDIESAQGSELKADLRDFQFTAAKEIVCVGGKQNKNAIVLFIPFRVWREAKKVVGRLVRELEKKFQKKHVIIVANRTIYDKSFRELFSFAYECFTCYFSGLFDVCVSCSSGLNGLVATKSFI